MMKRRIFLWMGLIVLFLSFGLSGEALAKEAAYKVKRGDSISIIAKKNGVTIEALQETNGLDGGTLKTGQSLVIPKRVKQRTAKKSPLPKSSSYRVKKGDNLYGISRKTGFSVSEIKEANNLRSNNLKIGQKIILSKKADTGREETAKYAAKSTEMDDSEEDGGLVDASTDNLPLAEADNSINSDAELLGKWHNPEERKLLVKVATAFLGAPYRLGGISLRGLDCSAFVKKIYDLFDVSLPRTAREQASVGVRIAKGELVEGDLVFFNTRRAFGHVGIYIGNNEFVHASSLQKRVRISSLDEPYFNKRFVKAVRLKGLDEEIL